MKKHEKYSNDKNFLQDRGLFVAIQGLGIIASHTMAFQAFKGSNKYGQSFNYVPKDDKLELAKAFNDTHVSPENYIYKVEHYPDRSVITGKSDNTEALNEYFKDMPRSLSNIVQDNYLTAKNEYFAKNKSEIAAEFKNYTEIIGGQSININAGTYDAKVKDILTKRYPQLDGNGKVIDGNKQYYQDENPNYEKLKEAYNADTSNPHGGTIEELKIKLSGADISDKSAQANAISLATKKIDLAFKKEDFFTNLIDKIQLSHGAGAVAGYSILIALQWIFLIYSASKNKPMYKLERVLRKNVVKFASKKLSAVMGSSNVDKKEYDKLQAKKYKTLEEKIKEEIKELIKLKEEGYPDNKNNKLGYEHKFAEYFLDTKYSTITSPDSSKFHIGAPSNKDKAFFVRQTDNSYKCFLLQDPYSFNKSGNLCRDKLEISFNGGACSKEDEVKLELLSKQPAASEISALTPKNDKIEKMMEDYLTALYRAQKKVDQFEKGYLSRARTKIEGTVKLLNNEGTNPFDLRFNQLEESLKKPGNYRAIYENIKTEVRGYKVSERFYDMVLNAKSSVSCGKSRG